MPKIDLVESEEVEFKRIFDSSRPKSAHSRGKVPANPMVGVVAALIV